MFGSQEVYCSDIAREKAIPLVGTAPQRELWFLLEYNSRWGSKAFEESTIPEAVKKYLSSVGNSPRILLIQKGGSAQREELRFFVVMVDPLEPELYEYPLNTYQDILEIDLSALVNGSSEDLTNLRESPLFLVCTNGKRDKCCARNGTEIFPAMREKAGEAVWQCSHINGHNMSPTTLFFPHGVNYGQTSTDDIRYLIREYQDRRIGLDHYRGRVCFDQPVQAAEHFWRQETGILDLPGMKLDSFETVGENEWRIDISGVDDSNRLQFHIQRRESEIEIPISCSMEKVKKISSFQQV